MYNCLTVGSFRSAHNSQIAVTIIRSLNRRCQSLGIASDCSELNAPTMCAIHDWWLEDRVYEIAALDPFQSFDARDGDSRVLYGTLNFSVSQQVWM